MNLGIMTINKNDPEHVIDNPKDFGQYHIWILSRHKEKTLQPTTIKFSTVQLYVGSKSHVLTEIKIFAYIRPVQWSAQIINYSKAPAKGFCLVIIKSSKQTLLYHYDPHIVYHITHKTLPFKLNSNI